MKRARAYGLFEKTLEALGVPPPKREYMFFPGRQWRSDFAWPAERFAVEIDGGAWIGAGHTRGSGFTRDQAKRNAYAMMGYRVMTFLPKETRNGKAVKLIRRWFWLWGSADVKNQETWERVERRIEETCFGLGGSESQVEKAQRKNGRAQT